jgi:collagenase-like PrtC family protease
MMYDYLGERFDAVLSPELNIAQINDLAEKVMNVCEPYVFVYGNLPVMTLAHCVKKVVNNKCDCKSCDNKNEIHYADKKHTFTIRRKKVDKCYFTVYNSVPHDALKLVEKIKANLYYGGMFTGEGTTTGHLKRGV